MKILKITPSDTCASSWEISLTDQGVRLFNAMFERIIDSKSSVSERDSGHNIYRFEIKNQEENEE